MTINPLSKTPPSGQATPKDTAKLNPELEKRIARQVTANIKRIDKENRYSLEVPNQQGRMSPVPNNRLMMPRQADAGLPAMEVGDNRFMTTFPKALDGETECLEGLGLERFPLISTGIRTNLDPRPRRRFLDRRDESQSYSPLRPRPAHGRVWGTKSISWVWRERLRNLNALRGWLKVETRQISTCSGGCTRIKEKEYSPRL